MDRKKYITIIGSRQLTKNEYLDLKWIAEALYDKGYILRSGAAKGADSVINHLENVEIYIPWRNFSYLKHDGKRVFELGKLPDQFLAERKAKEIHPNPKALSPGALKLHTRNIYQVIGYLGSDGVKSDAVVYVSDSDILGRPLGGTRTAVEYAKSLGVPTYNLRTTELTRNEIVQKIIVDSGFH